VTLIQGGYRDRGARSAKRHPGDARRRANQRRKVRAAAPLLVPLALALTLGVILAVSSAPSTSHVNQQSSTTSTTQP
jgi:hypothetical protein